MSLVARPVAAVLFALIALAGGLTSARGDNSASTPNGTSIICDVNLSFQPTSNAPSQTVTSNTASVTVQQVAGVNLTPAVSGRTVTTLNKVQYPITLTNTGSTSDTFTLTCAPASGWTYTLTLANGGGSAPSQVALNAGQSQGFVLAVTPTGTVAKNPSGTIVLTAVSSNDSTQSAQSKVQTTYRGSPPPTAPAQ